MSSQLGHIAATASLNIDPFQQSTRIIETQIRSLDKALKAQETAFENNGKSVNGLKGIYGQTGKSIESYSALLEKQKKKYQDLKTDIGDVNTATSEQKRMLLGAEAAMNTTAGKLETLTGKYNKLGREIAIQDSNWTKVGDQLGIIGKKAETLGKGLGEIGSSMTKGLTLPIVGAVGLAVKAAIDFESGFAGVKKTVDEVYDSNGKLVISYDDLAQGIRDMAKELPASTTEINEVAEAAGQLGIKTENVLSFSKTMIDLGESTNLGAGQAADSLARFANITQMSQGDFDRLGSSLVDLGNNYATTESEIVALGMRLAGVGAQVGMSEAEIMGLAAAMSSVGIEAEAGGSAMTQSLKKMQNAVAAHADVNERLAAAAENLSAKDFKKFRNEVAESEHILASFADVAGMTSDQFADLFTDDPARALQKYVEGLEKASKNGENLNEILGMVEISGIREADAMLRLAGNSKLVGEALDTSTKAFEENTALTEEASKRYETTEAKLQMLKNQAMDVAIEMGGPFVDALRDGLVAAEPLITTLSDLAQSFSNASPETQQMVIKTLAFTAAAGPMLSILGKVLTVTGKGTSSIGSLSKKIGEMSGTAKASKVALDAGSIGMAGMTGKAATLTAGIGAIGPALLIVGGVLAAGVVAWELWGKEAVASAERTKQWGSDVGEEAGKALDEFTSLSEGAALATDKMAVDIEGGAKKAIQSYTDMTSSVKDDVQSTIDDSTRILSELPKEVSSIIEKSVNSSVKEQTKLIAEIENIQTQITSIYENAMAESREVSNDELVVIENYHTRLAEIRSETLNLSAEEQRNVHRIMVEDLKSFSKDQLARRLSYLNEEKESLREKYEEQSQMIEDMLISGDIKTQEEYNSAMSELRKANKDDMLAIGAEYVKVWEEQGNVSEEVQENILNKMGVTSSEVKKYMVFNSDAVEESMSHIVRTTEGASDKVREANNVWNEMVLQGGDSLREFIQDANATEEGWNNLQFALHWAEMDSNSQEMIQEAMMANGTWWNLDFPPKWAELDTNVSGQAVSFLQSLGIWEGLDFPIQTAILDSNTKEQVKQALIDAGTWDSIDPKKQELFMYSNSTQVVGKAKSDIAEWNGAKMESKYPTITATTNAWQVAGSAQAALDSVKSRTAYIETVHTTTMANSMSGAYATRAKGDSYFSGGKAWLGDGGKNEPYLTPQGDFGVSPDDWTLYDLPRGTKVWPSIKNFLSDIPRFAEGTNIGDTRLMQAISKMPGKRNVEPGNRDNPSVNTSPMDYGALSSTISSAIAQAMQNVFPEEMAVFLEDRVVGKMVGDYANNSGGIKVKFSERGLAGN